jgi:DNA adenine methylase
MGFGSAGATKATTGFRIDTKRAYGTAQQLWAEYPKSLSAVGQRFSGVLIENRPAIEVMQQHDGPETLHFVDPPYMHETRYMQSSGRGCYKHEMSDQDHVELLDTLQSLKGMVIVTGYETDLYNQSLHDWQVNKTEARISSGRGTDLRTEVLWMNPACTQALELPLFRRGNKS